MEEEKSIAETIWNSILLGPFFLAVMLFLTSLQPFFCIDLWFIAIVGIYGIWKGRKQKMIFFWAAFLIFLILKHLFFLKGNHLWFLGLETSMALGFFITIQSFYRMNEIIQATKQNRKNLLEKVELIEEELKTETSYYEQRLHYLNENLRKADKDLEDKEKEIQSLQDLIETIKKMEREEREEWVCTLEEKDRRMNQMQEDLNELQQEEQYLKNHRDWQEWIEEINALRLDNTQSFYINEMLAKMIANRSRETIATEKEKQREEEKSQVCVFDNKNVSLSLRRLQADYAQLRKQFEEKDLRLHEARKERFSLSEKLLAHEKEKELQMYEETNLEGTLWTQWSSLQSQLSQAEEEKRYLEEIITKMLQDLTDEKASLSVSTKEPL